MAILGGDYTAFYRVFDILKKEGYYDDSRTLKYHLKIDDMELYRDIISKDIIRSYIPYSRYDSITKEYKNIEIEDVIDFVRQFTIFADNDSEFEQFCIEMFGNLKKEGFLKKIKIIHEQDILDFLEFILNFVQGEKWDISDVNFFNIGNIQDSASLMAYSFNKINDKSYHDGTDYKIKVDDIEKIEVSDIKKNIIFFDDAYYSGTQLLDVFHSYVAKENKRSEQHNSKLSDEKLKILKESNIYLIFMYGNNDIKLKLESEINRLGFKNIKIIEKNKFPKPFFESETQYATVKKMFLKVGEMLIRNKSLNEDGEKKDHWSEERIKNSFLGYNGAEQLIVFQNNTPTYTMTPLWLYSELKVNNELFIWKPLFKRTNK